jgi:hypothetical protein
MKAREDVHVHVLGEGVGVGACVAVAQVLPDEVHAMAHPESTKLVNKWQFRWFGR